MSTQKHAEIETRARENVRQTLAKSASFQGLSRADQFSLYKELLENEKNRLSPSLSEGMATRRNRRRSDFQLENRKASDMIDEARYQNQENLNQADDRLASMVDKVNFPKFVSDLLKGVFDANLDVTVKQMQQYQQLLKSATQSLSKFVKEINDEEAYYKLVEEKDDQFSISLPDFDEGGNGDAVILTDKDGNQVDTEDSKIKAMVMDAKLNMAKERRAMLRETILMGVTRLVVERGTVKAGVVFDIKSTAKTTRTDSARSNTQKARKGNRTNFGIGFGAHNFSYGRSTTNEQQTEISVATNTGMTDDELKAKLTGEVEIQFKSDYFKLDNFAKMYGGLTEEEIAEGKEGEQK